MSFIRKIKKKSGTYLALVENYREDGKVKQRVLKYIGKEEQGEVVRRVRTNDVRILEVKRSLDVDIIDHLATELNLKQFLTQEMLVMVYSQILDRPAMDKLEKWLSQTEIPNVLELRTISTFGFYDAIEKLNDMDFRKIEMDIIQKLKQYEMVKTSIVIDITDTYFEGKSIEGKRRRGKDGKVKKLIQIGLGVTKENGFPILHNTYDGNISDSKIFRDMIIKLWEKGFDSIIVDRGMHNKTNLETLQKIKAQVICGVKKTEFFQSNYLDKVKREDIYSKVNRVKLKNTQVYIKSSEFNKGKIIVIYNPHLEFVKREIHYENGGKDETGKYLGYSLIYHNTPIECKKVLMLYFEKDIIERVFKQLKGILSIRPVRFWLRDHIKAHIKICYLAYAILSLLQYKLRKLNLSAPEALDILKTGYRVYLKDNSTNFQWNTTITLRKDQQKIIDVVYKNR